MPTQNIGVSSVDHNVDRVVGARSHEQWEGIEERHSHKRQILRDHPGATGHDLSRLPDGDYRVMQRKETTDKRRFLQSHNARVAALGRRRQQGIS